MQPGYPDSAIYIVLSRTQTRFGRCIRLVARQQYNHVSIALDPALTQLYAYARPQQYALLQGGLVRETQDRYTVGGCQPVPVAVYRLPVSAEDHRWVKETIETMYRNPDYLYNLFSVLTYPVLRGFSVERAFSCVEFAAWLLHALGYVEEGPFCRYAPDDLRPLLAPYLVYEGDIRGCLPWTGADREYFAPLDWHTLTGGIAALARITRRSVFQRLCG